MKHALVVGGTGMLAGVSLWLVKQGYHVSVIGRSTTRLKRLVDLAEPRGQQISPLSVDYRDTVALREKIEQSIENHGPIELVVSWIHAIAPDALQNIDDVVSRHIDHEWTLFHVRSSTSYISRTPAKTSDSCRYRQVFLGFILTAHGSRWLTDEEIATGVISAVENDQVETVVGTLEPWNQRP